MEYFDCPLDGKILMTKAIMDEVFDGELWYTEHPIEQGCYVGDVVCEVRQKPSGNELQVKATWKPEENVLNKLEVFVSNFNKKEAERHLAATLFYPPANDCTFTIAFERWEEGEEY